MASYISDPCRNYQTIELVELCLDSVTYEALSIYNVLANIVFARRYKENNQ